MAKSKQTKSVPNKHLHARVSYLYQAATYLAAHSTSVSAVSLTDNNKVDCTSKKAFSAETVVRDGVTQSHGDMLAGNCKQEQKQEQNHEADATRAANVPQNTSKHSKAKSSMAIHDPSTPTTSLHPQQTLISTLRAVSRKAQIRLSTQIKRSVCRRCDALLVPAETSTVEIENHSRGGKKAWADVLVVRCLCCGTVKRFPVGAERQVRRGLRGVKGGEGGEGVDGAKLRVG